MCYWEETVSKQPEISNFLTGWLSIPLNKNYLGSGMSKSNNPWSVSDASVFLKYCCPECDYSNKNLPSFSKHALKNHVLANTLFNNDNDDSENQIVTIVKSEDQENFKSEVTDEHNDIDTTVIKDEPIAFDDGKLMKLIFLKNILITYYLL